MNVKWIECAVPSQCKELITAVRNDDFTLGARKSKDVRVGIRSLQVPCLKENSIEQISS